MEWLSPRWGRSSERGKTGFCLWRSPDLVMVGVVVVVVLLVVVGATFKLSDLCTIQKNL